MIIITKGNRPVAFGESIKEAVSRLKASELDNAVFTKHGEIAREDEYILVVHYDLPHLRDDVYEIWTVD